MTNLFVTKLFAAEVCEGDAVFCNPIGAGRFFELIEKVLGVLVQIGLPILVLAIVYAGFKFITAQGNEAEVTKAKDALFWAVVGGAVLLGAEVIAKVIQSTVGTI